MASATGHRPARRFARHLFLGLARCLALVWLVPALVYNVDWTGHGDLWTNGSAVLMILGSALFIEGAHRSRSWVLAPLLVAASLLLVLVNTKQATRNLSLASEAASEAKQAKIDSASHLASHRSRLESRRIEQVKLAGETAVGALEAEVAVVIASDARQWRISSQCEAPNGPITGAYCTQVAAARAKVEAARKRDEIDAEIAKLPAAPVENGQVVVVPAVADSYVANIKALAAELGYQPTDRLIKAEEALTRAFSFEVLAALGPTCWLMFVNIMFGIGERISTAAGRRKETQAKAAKVAIPEAKDPGLKATTDDIDRWIADDLEECATGSMTPKELRAMCHAWCKRAGVATPAERDLWPRMAARFKHDSRNNRPRYLGVKARAKLGPRLAVNNDQTA